MQTFIERVRGILGLRQVRYGANASAMSVLFIAIMVMLNVLAVRYPQRLDVTATQEFSLSQQSKQIVAELTQPLTITGYYSANDRFAQDDVETRLKGYVAASGQVSYRFIDPDKDPVSARNDEITAYGTLVVRYGDRKATTQTGDEQAITGAILQVTQDTKPVVYVLTGHRERTVDDFAPNQISEFRTVLAANNFDVESMNLSITAEIPPTNSVLLIADPQDEIAPDEYNKIVAYMQAGGRLLLLSNPLSPAPMASLLETWGLQWQDNFVVDEQSQMGNPLAPAVVEYPFTPITRDMGGQATLFNSVRTIKESAEAPSGVTRRVLLRSSERSSAATEFVEGQVKVNANDELGPLAFGYMVELPNNGRVVLIGDVDFLSNGYLKLAQANGAFAKNAVAWLSAQDALIALPTAEPVNRQIFLTADQSTIIFLTSVIGLPLIFIVSGIWIWWRRR